MKSKLESEGIMSFLFDENIIGINPLYNITVGGIKLKIDRSDQEAALKILEEYTSSKTSNEKGEIIQCPKCKSSEIYTGFKSMKGIKGVLSSIISLLLLVFPIFYKTVFKCKDCNYEFNL